MSNMKYKGYIGSVEVNMEDNCLHGKLRYVNDTVSYEAQTPSDLERAFQESVDDYLQTCKELGREPKKTLSGTFNVRVGEELHRRATVEATLYGKSLNQYVRDALERVPTYSSQEGFRIIAIGSAETETVITPDNMRQEWTTELQTTHH